MSSDRSLEDVWHDQVTMARARGDAIPTRTDPAYHDVLREIMGDEVFDRAMREESEAALAVSK